MDKKEKLFKKGQIIELKISSLAFGGTGIAKVPTEQGDFAVFVENTIPGQLVRARVTKSANRHAECSLEEILAPSPIEQEIPYQAIPGAPYATVPIATQELWKKQNTFELFRRIGKIDHVENVFDEYISSPESWHYRNKMEYSFSAIRYDLNAKEERDDFGFGFKRRGTWWMVENLDKESGLFDEQLETSIQLIRKWCENSGLPAWHPPKREGFWRYLVARKSFYSDTVLLNLVTSDSSVEQFDTEGFIALIQNILGSRLAGLIHTINNEVADRADPLNGKSQLLVGNRTIHEHILDLEFEISMTSFFQTNPRSAERLYSKVMSYVNEVSVEGDTVMDLFCGTGTITQLLAKGTAGHVIGVDIVESAIRDAVKNAERNKVGNIEFYAADVGRFLLEYPEYEGKISTLVLDPPRGGIAPKTLRKIIALKAKNIVYVSCNPATQARDAEILAIAGYELKKISFVDQFPHTSHVEAVALLQQK